MSGSLELDLYSLEVHFNGSDKDDGDSTAAASHPVLVALDDTEVKRIKSTLRSSGVSRELYLWNRRDPMVRVQAKLGAPDPAEDGRVTLKVKHFEVVVVPLALTLTRKAVATLVDFFANEAKEKRHDVKARAAFLPGASAAASAASASAAAAAPVAAASGEPAPRASGAKAAAATAGRDARALLFGADATSRGSPAAPGSPTSGDEGFRADGGGGKAPAGGLHLQYLRLGQLLLFVSYRGENWAKLEDFDSLQVKIHPFVARDQVTSLSALAVGVRNHVVVDLLSQVSRNFVNIGAFLATKFSWCSSSDATEGVSQGSLARAAADAGAAAAEAGDGRDSRALLFGRTQEPGDKAPSFLEKMRVFKR
jgi:hypothetical protein